MVLSQESNDPLWVISLLSTFAGIWKLWAFPMNPLSLAAPGQWSPVFLLYVNLIPTHSHMLLHQKMLPLLTHGHKRLVLSMVRPRVLFSERIHAGIGEVDLSFTEWEVISHVEGMQYACAREPLSGTLGQEE